jgi:trans-AT polyketide synthase/acyltransferase/oxidoreductase domain-containing protein
VLERVERPCYVSRTESGIGVTDELELAERGELLAVVSPLSLERLGDGSFRVDHGLRHAYMAGAMANGIASEELVIALARAGCLGSFGAAGLLPERIERALDAFEQEIPNLPFACNLIHSPHEERLERSAVDIYLARGVRCVEASAFMALTPHIVRYRVAGLERLVGGEAWAHNRVVAKVSRAEVAEQFLLPAPAAIVGELLAQGLISAEQADLAARVPMADDITVEADSGGHTDRRPLSALLPVILRLRDRVHQELGYRRPPRIGAAGGIGTPEAAAGALAAGASYVVTGSINQACVESAASPHTRELLAQAGVADCEMAPAADMFELGVELQVLRRGTMFPMRAKRLYELYRSYGSIEEIPAQERHKLETQVFRRGLDDVWRETEAYFERRDPAQVERARANPKRRMALVFRWYLGMSSRWSNTGEPGRELDYQIWCGPSIGAFNDWVAGTYLADPAQRRAADVAHQLLRGTAFTLRVSQLRAVGVRLPTSCARYRPAAPIQIAGPAAPSASEALA